jgi:hypothetical protein
MASFGGFDRQDNGDRAQLLGEEGETPQDEATAGAAAGATAAGNPQPTQRHRPLRMPRGRRRAGSSLASSLGRPVELSEGVDDILGRVRTISFASDARGRNGGGSRRGSVASNVDQINRLPDNPRQSVVSERDGGAPAAAAAVTSDDELGLTGCAGSYFCHPKRGGHKILGVFFMCMLGFGSYFCFDNPGALQNQIKNDMAVSTFMFSTLYSWYSVPNVVLPLIGGVLMDSVLGLRLGTIVWATFIMLGQVITAYGAFAGNFIPMQIGRFVFGIGGESLAVAQNTYTVLWFRGKGLNMIFGLQVKT